MYYILNSCSCYNHLLYTEMRPLYISNVKMASTIYGQFKRSLLPMQQKMTVEISFSAVY